MAERGVSANAGKLTAALEAAIVSRAQRGEEAAFQALFEAHRRRVYSLCWRMTHNTPDAEDLTQEAFLHAFKKITTFRGESTFSTWLHRLTVNEVLMHLRKKRLHQVSLDEVDTSQEEPVTRECRDDDRRLMGTIDRINLNQAIADLPLGYRTAFVLHDVEGYEHREIARMKNWSIGNSKSQLHKARRKLRDWLRLRGRKASSTNGARVSSEYKAKKRSALRDGAQARGMDRLEPGILTH